MSASKPPCSPWCASQTPHAALLGVKSWQACAPYQSLNAPLSSSRMRPYDLARSSACSALLSVTRHGSAAVRSTAGASQQRPHQAIAGSAVRQAAGHGCASCNALAPSFRSDTSKHNFVGTAGDARRTSHAQCSSARSGPGSQAQVKACTAASQGMTAQDAAHGTAC